MNEQRYKDVGIPSHSSLDARHQLRERRWLRKRAIIGEFNHSQIKRVLTGTCGITPWTGNKIVSLVQALHQEHGTRLGHDYSRTGEHYRYYRGKDHHE